MRPLRIRIPRGVAVVGVALLASAHLSGGCLDVDAADGSAAPAVGQVTQAVGEPINGIPDYNERTAHHMTNRVRAGFDCGDPSLVCSSAPARPLAWNYTIGEAARFHSVHMHDVPCFQHTSCCTLVDNGGVIECDSAGYTCPGGNCDYTPDCPGTSASARMSMFGAPYAGENIAAGNATGEATICQWYNSSGHHDNMCNPSHGHVGIGHHGGTNCWNHYWTQDFAGGAPPAGITSASHWGSSAAPTFGAAFYDPGATGSPQQTRVVIDGVCHTLVQEYGNDEISTWALQQTPGAGCHRYWFLFVSQGGTRYAFPSTGSYQVGSGCSGDYSTTQDPADCETNPPECNNGATEPCYDGPPATRNVGICTDGQRTCANDVWGPCTGQVQPAAAETCDNSLDDDCNGAVDDGCPGSDSGVVTPDGGTTTDAGSTSDGGPGTDGATTSDASPTSDASGGLPPDTIRGGCHCRAGGGADGSAALWLLLVLGLLWRRRRG